METKLDLKINWILEFKLAINTNPNERLCYSVSAGRVNRQLFAVLHNIQYEVILCQYNCNLLHRPKLAQMSQSMQVLKTNNDINTASLYFVHGKYVIKHIYCGVDMLSTLHVPYLPCIRV